MSGDGDWQNNMTKEVHELLMMIRCMGVDMRYNPNTFMFQIEDTINKQAAALALEDLV